MTRVNVLPGQGLSHRVSLDPESQVFRIEVGQARMPLFPLLKALGADPKALRQAWGDQIYESNLKHDDPTVVPKLFARLVRQKPGEHVPDRAAALKAEFERMKLDPWITKRTLGKEHATVSGDTFVDITRKLLAVNKKEAEVDDRDHAAFQQVLGPEDLFAERARMAARILRPLIFRAGVKGTLDPVQSGALSKILEGTITKSGLGQSLEEVSPADILDQVTRVTRMGVGGIPSIDSVPDEARSVQPSQFGFVDSLRTPESLKAGVDSRFATSIRKGTDGQMYAPMKDPRTGKLIWKSPRDLADAVIAFPVELDAGKKHVRALVGGKLKFVRRNQVEFVVPEMEDTFNHLTNLIPGKSGVKGQRVMMGSRMYAQALPLERPEAPLVQSAVPFMNNRSYEEEYGKHMGALHADQPGVVKAITPEGVVVQHQDGTTQTYETYDNFPLNRKTYWHNTPTVQVGQPVRKGDLLARSNFTDEKGATALGANFRVAFLPYRGSIAADTHVLWYQDGVPVFDEVRNFVLGPGREAVSVDQQALSAGVRPVRGFSAHPAPYLLRIRTSSGREIRATPEHSFVVLDEAGTLVEVRGADLVAGVSWLPRLGRVDLPVRVLETELRASTRKPARPVGLDFDFGLLCGLYAAEGSASDRRHLSIAATDAKVRATVCRLVATLFPQSNVGTCDRNQVIVYDSRLAVWMIENCGAPAQNKRVPDCAFAAPESFRKGFVAGFWTGDGRVHSRKDKPQQTDTLITSRRLRDGLGLLLASLGISTTHGNYEDERCSQGMIYRLSVSCRDAHRLPDISDFRTGKGDRLLEVIRSYKGCGSADHVPVLPASAAAMREVVKRAHGSTTRDYKRCEAALKKKTIGRRDLRTLAALTGDQACLRLADSPLEWDRVQSIETVPNTEWVYDFDMAPDRTFVCVDTLVVHNSDLGAQPGEEVRHGTWL